MRKWLYYESNHDTEKHKALPERWLCQFQRQLGKALKGGMNACSGHVCLGLLWCWFVFQISCSWLVPKLRESSELIAGPSLVHSASPQIRLKEIKPECVTNSSCQVGQ